tara:strand:- start:107503 stop:108246 length:744 start_codon:yes stop_codon:yes gene_type:complete
VVELLTLPWLLLALFIFLAFTTEATTGFGSIVIALSLGALLFPIPELLPILVPLNIVMTSVLSWRHRHAIHWPTLCRMILPLMVVGTLAGYGLRPWLGDQLLKTAFGLLVLWFSSRELWRLWKGITVKPHGKVWSQFWMLMAGMTHGLFASGGPLLVYALSGLALDKQQFRATLILVWLSLNGLLTLVFLLDGSLLPAAPHIAVMIPVVIAAMMLGEWLHRRVNEARFRQAVFVVLWMTGGILAWPG